MSVYFDASALVPLFALDPFNVTIHNFLRTQSPTPVVSSFAEAEFCGVIARRVRTREMTEPAARAAFANLDRWASEMAQRIELISADIMEASKMLRRMDTSLRTPDAIHIAIAERVSASLLTFDRKMSAAANALGVTLASA